MYKIMHREDLTPQIHLFEIEAPAVARKAKAGQFVVLMVDEKGERFPLTIGGWDTDKGTVTIVFMEVGKSTRKLATLNRAILCIPLPGLWEYRLMSRMWGRYAV